MSLRVCHKKFLILVSPSFLLSLSLSHWCHCPNHHCTECLPARHAQFPPSTPRFGPGPHFCQFALKFPDDPDGAPHRTFVVQLAPLGSMPHAVHLFLEQVSHKLWDGGWFYLNGPHVLQAGPQAEEEEVERAREAGLSQRAAAIRPFRELLLDSLSFAEYSDDFPHLPWTLGFTGRPGGPDFYINKVDNTVSHGPGGQVHHESSSEHADACFAKVVDGFDTLEKMIKSPIVHDDESEDYQYFFEDPVQIMSVTIVGNPFHHPDPKEDVSVMGETSTGSGSGPASQELLESLHDLREERHGGENVYHHEPARNDHHDETNPDRHRLHRMKHRPEFDHMVEP